MLTWKEPMGVSRPTMNGIFFRSTLGRMAWYSHRQAGGGRKTMRAGQRVAAGRRTGRGRGVGGGSHTWRAAAAVGPCKCSNSASVQGSSRVHVSGPEVDESGRAVVGVVGGWNGGGGWVGGWSPGAR